MAFLVHLKFILASDSTRGRDRSIICATMQFMNAELVRIGYRD